MDAKLLREYSYNELDVYTTDRFGNENSAFKAYLSQYIIRKDSGKSGIEFEPTKMYTLMFWLQLFTLNNIQVSSYNNIMRFDDNSLFLQIQVEPVNNSLLLKTFDKYGNCTLDYATNFTLSNEWAFITFVQDETSLSYFVNGEFINSVESIKLV